MSIDIYLLDSAHADDLDAGMAALEASAGTKWSESDEKRWLEILGTLPLGLVAETSGAPGGARRAEHAATAVELFAHPGELGLRIPHTAGPAWQLVALLAQLVGPIEAEFGVIAFDLQTGSRLLDTGSDGRSVVTGRSKASFQSLMRQTDGLWRSRGLMIALTKDELKGLRSTKGDRARRQHVNTLMNSADGERLLLLGEEWGFLNALCAEPFSDLGIFVGQRMHKGNAHEITLLKDLPHQVGILEAHDPTVVASSIERLTDEAVRYRTHFMVLEDWDRAGIQDLASPEWSMRVATVWERLREFLQQSIDRELAPLFLVDHHRCGRRHYG